MSKNNDCENCFYYKYDDDYEDYICDVSMDEDEMAGFLGNSHYQCPYYQFNDEYKIVKKQI